MLLTIATTHFPATELGYLLHKHPDRCQSFSLSFGQAYVFYPEANAQQCTVALLLDVDPVKLVRGRSARLEQYVNDRPYVASSFLSVAIAQVFSTALGGRCKDRPELVQTSIPLTAKLSVLPCRGGESFLRELFEPLGYSVSAQGHTLNEEFPEWGQSQYFSVELQHTLLLSDLLSHLYVLIPVLDDDKHYWVGDEEIEKLLRHGEGWLTAHPAREQITKRYLKRQQRLTRLALAQLAEEDNLDPDSVEESHAEEEAAVEKPISLNQQRMNAVIAALKQSGAKRVIDLGCGQGTLLKNLLKDGSFEQITGVDVSYRALEVAKERLDRLRLPRNQWERLQLIQGALTYQDKRLGGYDAATVIEVIEHLDLPRLGAFERVLFEFTQPKTVVVTTPNIEYNIKFENLPAGKLRHKDHRFEWTRAEFQAWANRIAESFGYIVQFQPVGTEDPEIGSPTQMAVFSRNIMSG
ncbi:3' terminal RNA ribose 2'-O-methyltransferase Hen1 [Komarekiella sp. 'clone 1']|uniref:Small RNA 2'-O-methyltransferase n=1 Tax=Komarekiella delphini-convector SJRDD-AB1 TaxID=2593771 RepID=A0AA40T2E4_9NOST|nr:3' terminal RNA ribose 2'-O-methyltransferase Hen1 [Komarekiella delphini-convector]MBD6619676.1 3' terminal RNA ribose 2'-O-methyltransferase Hen1 [Komarekiella delphini-convector SJRDD-AB1]